MKPLTVSLNYASTMEFSPANTPGQTPLALPLRVLDGDGTLLAEGVSSAAAPAQFDLPEIKGPVFVRLTWPSGKTQTKRTQINKQGTYESVFFDDASISRNEWSSWAVPLLSENTSLANRVAKSDLHKSDLHIKKFDRVWLRMWTREPSGWSPSELQTPTAQYRNDTARQFDFQLDQKYRLLQVGGSRVAWRFVALPGGGACRVLLTPNESRDPRAERLKVLVTTFRRDAENLLEFLARDSMRAANALGAYLPLAQRLLSDKTEDPISAIAAAYFLLRSGGWSRIKIDLIEFLQRSTPWLADSSLILCTALLRRGLSSDADIAGCAFLLRESLTRGLPVFSEGILLLKEAISLLRSCGDAASFGETFKFVERLAASQAWSGAMLSFYGETPDRPSPEKVFGAPGNPRRSKKSGAIGAPTVNYDELASSFTLLSQVK